MKKLYILILLLSIPLTGCKNNDVENDDLMSSYALFEKETLGVFVDIDFSNYTITGIEKLLYDNGEADYEYESLTSIDDGFLENIIEISNLFADYSFSVGSNGVPVGGRPKLLIRLEDGERYINISIEGKNSSVTFYYINGNEKYYISYYSAFTTQIESIFNLVN